MTPVCRGAGSVAELTLADWIILGVVALSTLLSLWRGFAREAISLGAWVLAFMIATMFSPSMQVMLQDVIEAEQPRQIASFLILFILTLLAGSMAGFLIGQLIKVTGLSLADRVLGMAFGFVRGVVLALALVLVADLALEASGTAKPDWFGRSVLVPHLMLLENWARDSTARVLEWIQV